MSLVLFGSNGVFVIFVVQRGVFMNSRTLAITARQPLWREFLTLCKPRVVLLMVLTSVVGMCLATPGMIPWRILLLGNLGIALAACSAAVINHLVDRHIDKLMRRTERRPLVQGSVTPIHAIVFSAVLGFLGLGILFFWINTLTTILTFITLMGYAVIYTLYLKHATPQNIVIGGLAGAAPPLLGWVAVTGHIDPAALLLVLIIFIWTPPHFWALAIYRVNDYAKANVPMLPVTHGIKFTKLNILFYTILLTLVTVLPYLIRTVGVVYLVGVSVLNAVFLYWAVRLFVSDEKAVSIKTFRYSIWYLMFIFVFLLLDHYL